MKKNTKILIVTILSLIVISVIITYYRVFHIGNYEIISGEIIEEDF